MSLGARRLYSVKRGARLRIFLTPCFSAVANELTFAKPFKRLLARSAQHTWLKPGVNEILDGESNPQIDHSRRHDGRWKIIRGRLFAAANQAQAA
jgi:hypothetical protein